MRTVNLGIPTNVASGGSFAMPIPSTPRVAHARIRAESCFRAYVLTTHRSELTVIGHLSVRDWESVKARVRTAFAS